MPAMTLGIILRYLMLVLLFLANGVYPLIGVNDSPIIIPISGTVSVFSHDIVHYGNSL
jgi:hypothetical protein